MLSEQAPLLSLRIFIFYGIEQAERRRLILKILKNRQLTGFAGPIDEIDLL